MERRFMALVLVCVMGFVSLGFSQMPRTFRVTDRIAVSHDGNNWDKDDTYAYAMDYAVIWAFGLQKQLVHAQINNLLSAHNSETFRAQMLESGKGRYLFPGFDTSVQFDCVNNYTDAKADFKNNAEQGTDNSILYFTLAGPMETAWQSINSTATDKRKYIHCVSHSNWNENHTTSTLKHTWSNLQSSFGAQGTKFTKISDQNANIGGIGSSKWDFLKNMPTSTGVPQSTWTWLRGRDFKANGDISDNGMVWYIITGSQNARYTDYEARFKSPIQMEVSVKPSNTLRTINQSFAMKINQSGRVLNVSAPGMEGSGFVVVYDQLGKVISNGAMANGKARLACPSKLNGTYVVKIMSKNGSVSQKVTLN